MPSSENKPPDPEQDNRMSETNLPVGLRRPVASSLTRMLAGRPMDEEILDPANPNLQWDRESRDNS